MDKPSNRRATRADPVPCYAVSVTADSASGFHRCYTCSEYPELAGPVAIKVSLDGSGFKWGICARCVRAMASALEDGVVVTE